MAVKLDPRLMEVLACPCDDRAPLRPGTAADPAAQALTCVRCGRSYPVSDGIPVMLIDEALPGTAPQPGTEARPASAPGSGAGGATPDPQTGAPG